MLDGDLGATFEAAALQDFATGFRGDTCSKSVSLGAMPRMWLKRSFWHIAPYYTGKHLRKQYVFEK